MSESFFNNLLQIAHEHDMQKMGRRCGDQMWEHGKALGGGDLEQAKKSEYHRGYTDGLHARDTATWQLDQERREVVRALRDFNSEEIESWFEMQFWTLLTLLGIEKNAEECSNCNDIVRLRDRLIHLLGGDTTKPRKPSISDEESESKLSKSADMTNKTITEELRKFKGHINAGLTPEMVLALRAEVNVIADRIEEQFNRICQQQDDAWQATCEQMAEQHEEEVESLKRAAERDADHIEILTGTLNDAEMAGKELATKVKNQRKRLNQLENIVNTWHYEDGTYWSPIAADKAVRKANEKAERLHVRNYEQALRIAALSEECEMYRDMLNDATEEYKLICRLCDTIEHQRDYWHQEATDNIQRPYGRA